MSDNQLPKATMSNFIRDRIKDKKKVSAEFTNLMLDLSKEFIDKVSATANQICQREGKKTINNDHLYKSLQELDMGNFVVELQKLDESLKLKQQRKQQVKKQVQEKIEQMNKQIEAKNEENNVPANILIEPRVNDKTIEIDNEEEDFREYLNIDEENADEQK